MAGTLSALEERKNAEKSESYEKNNSSQDENDPFVAAIINELGGEEIR